MLEDTFCWYVFVVYFPFSPPLQASQTFLQLPAYDPEACSLPRQWSDLCCTWKPRFNSFGTFYGHSKWIHFLECILICKGIVTQWECLSLTQCRSKHFSNFPIEPSGQIIIFHQPRFPWNVRGFPLLNHLLGWKLVWGRYNLPQNHRNSSASSSILVFLFPTAAATGPPNDHCEWSAAPVP